MHVHENEIQTEIQKQLKMMPGQEKIVMDYYEKNPSASESLRGTIYEDKIIDLIKSKAKITKKEVSKHEAENILKAANDHSQEVEKDQKIASPVKSVKSKKIKTANKKPIKTKKVSKK